MDVLSTLVGAFFALVASTLVIAGVLTLRRSLRLLIHGVRAPGRVVGWVRVRSPGGEHGDTHHPRVRFRHPDGRDVEFTSEISGSRRRWPVGHAVSVAVLGDGPRDAEVVRPGLLLAGPVVMFVLGAASLWVAVAALFR